MGGGIALQLALRHPEALGAAFALSSFMCDDAAVYRRLEDASSAGTMPKLLMMHGEADVFIKLAWGRNTAERLKGLGLPIEFVPLPGLNHELSRKEISFVRKWLCDVLNIEDSRGRAETAEL
mmetsp:Transcript_76248/g.205683  ORF Transcript_76248/g.205683 Transcript_76248/m.205683 type:complete len:122 (+) Transcript_76248:221-586(+)